MRACRALVVTIAGLVITKVLDPRRRNRWGVLTMGAPLRLMFDPNVGGTWFPTAGTCRKSRREVPAWGGAAGLCHGSE